MNSLRLRLTANPPPSRGRLCPMPKLTFHSSAALIEGNGQAVAATKRLPPGGSWQHRKVLTEGERGSDIAVKLGDADWHHPPVFIPALRRTTACMWTGCCRKAQKYRRHMKRGTTLRPSLCVGDDEITSPDRPPAERWRRPGRSACRQRPGQRGTRAARWRGQQRRRPAPERTERPHWPGRPSRWPRQHC